MDNYSHAVITALIGAIVWGMTSFFIGWIPLLGPPGPAGVDLGNWRYPCGWGDAAIIGVVTWLADVVAVILDMIGIDTDVMGVPSV